ncbi:MAG: hypothetical protein E6Q59_10505 [Nitrosomonas sp.]|nr:MAG: hypothetical protein E6Q59_10505 [Nitrosomonas sp.]
MSENSESSDYAYLVLDTETRLLLTKKLNRAIASQDKYLSEKEIQSEVNKFIDSVELISNSIGFYRKFRIDKQQRRKERLESIANHLDGIIDQIKALDRNAIIYASMTVWKNPPPRIEKCSSLEISNQAENTAFDIASGDSVIIKELSAYAFNVREAARTLPKCIGDKPMAANYERSLEKPELGMAVELENLFHKYRIKFTITNTGLAADCLRAIYCLSGLGIDRVDYWLKRACESPFSSRKWQEK